jgi:hypothetical protein
MIVADKEFGEVRMSTYDLRGDQRSSWIACILATPMQNSDTDLSPEPFQDS